MAKVTNQEKSSMIRTLSSQLGVDMPSVMVKYSDQYFKDSSINKLEFFREVVMDTLSGPSKTFLTEHCDLPFFRDRRSPVDYGVELAFGWIIEDVILYAIASEGIDIEMQGLDQAREYLESNNISSRSDYKINIASGTKSLELVTSWGDYWQSTDTLDLRKTKYNNMVTKVEGTIVLGVEAPTQKGFVFDMADVKDAFVVRDNPAWGGKPAYSLSGMSTRMLMVSDAIKQIKNL